MLSSRSLRPTNLSRPCEIATSIGIVLAFSMQAVLSKFKACKARRYLLRIRNQRITGFNCQGSVEACGCSKHVSGIAGADWLSLGGSAWENCVRSPYVWEIERLGHTGTSVIDIRRMSWSRNGNSGFHPLNPLQYYETIVRFGVDSMIRGPSEQDLCKSAECAVGVYDDMRQEVPMTNPRDQR